jgi:hypothetical protein
MGPLPDLRHLRESLQRQHVEHVRVELDLTRTFLDLYKLEKKLGEAGSAARSLHHAQRALFGARKGLPNIQVQARRDAFEAEIKALEEKIAQQQAA